MATYLQLRTAIGAAGSTPNNVNGTAIDVVGVPAVLTIFGNADIVGMNHTLNMFVGGESRQPIPTSALSLASTVGTVKKDEDFIARIAVPAGARLVHTVNNPGAASNHNFLYILESRGEASQIQGAATVLD